MAQFEKEKKPAKVISFINMKGGVGKTSLTVNVADTLVHKGYRVLVIDMDPQFNATQTLLLHEVTITRGQNISKQTSGDSTNENAIEKEIEDEIKSSDIYDRLEKENKTVLNFFRKASIVSDTDVIHTIKDGLDLIAGNLDLTEEVGGDTTNKDSVIKKFIEENELRNDYHFILIDCPPTWSILTHASLFASDFYIIPSKVDFYSALGINLLEKQIKNKLVNCYTYKQMGFHIENLGIVFTLVHRNIKAEELRMDKIKEKISASIKIFDTKVPYFPSAPTKLNIYSDMRDHGKYSELTNSIEKVTEEILGIALKERVGKDE